LIRIRGSINFLLSWALCYDVQRQAAFKGLKLKPVKCFLVLLSEVFKRPDSSNNYAGIVLLIDELFIQFTYGLYFRIRLCELIMSAVQLEEFLKFGLAEQFVNLFIIDFIKLLVKFHELFVFLRNPLDFPFKSGTGIKHSLFKVKDEWLQLFVRSFNSCEISFNLFSEGSPFLMLFFDFIYYKDDLMFVLFGAAFHAIVRVGLVVRTTLL
jgi:hypothetical protein